MRNYFLCYSTYLNLTHKNLHCKYNLKQMECLEINMKNKTKYLEKTFREVLGLDRTIGI